MLVGGGYAEGKLEFSSGIPLFYTKNLESRPGSGAMPGRCLSQGQGGLRNLTAQSQTRQAYPRVRERNRVAQAQKKTIRRIQWLVGATCRHGDARAK